MPRARSRDERARGDGLDGHRALLAHLHDGALAELLLDLAEGHLECLVVVLDFSFRGPLDPRVLCPFAMLFVLACSGC